jgi:hypothetical protein
MATNLEFITSTTISSSQTTTDIDNIFSANYDNYFITIQGLSTVGTTNTSISGRLIDNTGSVITASEYDYAVLEMKANTTFSENKNTSFSRIDRITQIDQDPEAGTCALYVFNPYDSSSYTFLQWQSARSIAGSGGGLKGIAVHKVAETIRGFHILDPLTTSPYDTGKISVYGVK